MTNSAPNYHWLKQIPSALLQADDTPLIGFPPAFPWEQLSVKLSEIFDVPGILIKPQKTFEWRTEADLCTGLGDSYVPMQISIAPINATLTWVMPAQDLTLIMSILLAKQSQPLEVIDPEFKKGFYHFLALETVHAFSTLDFDKRLSFQVLSDPKLPKENALCLDVSIDLMGKTVWARVIFNEDSRRKWKEYYTERTLDVPIAKKLDLTIHLEAGKVELSQEEWKQVSAGDVILLDSCSLQPNGEGDVMLTIDGIPLFRGALKDGKINIEEVPLYHEGETL